MISSSLDSSAVSSTLAKTSQQPSAEEETPRLRRSSRSRTRSPEPVQTTKIQDPQLEAVQEEEEQVQQQQQSEEMYEKIIDEMDVDQNQGHDEYDEDALLAESNESNEHEQSNIEQEKIPESQNGDEEEQQQKSEEQMETSESAEKSQEGGSESEENRGVKRRAESPSKETSPKKRQRLPPPNIDDFVNDEDEPELDENSLQLSWCKLIIKSIN